MPYASDAQRRFFNANRQSLESEGVDVDEWNRSSKGKKLPERKKSKKKDTPRLSKEAMHVYSTAQLLAEAEPGTLLYSAVQHTLKAAMCCARPKKRHIFSVLSGEGDTSSPTPPTTGGSCMAAACVKLGNMRKRHLLVGPFRRSYLARSEMHKSAFAGRAVTQADPNVAWQQLMGMMHPTPTPAAAGMGQQPVTPGGEFGGRNTPSTNPIGMMSGLGVDPGGSSVMGNAAFGTQNNAMKSASPNLWAWLVSLRS